MEDDDVVNIVRYALRRWLRAKRGPDDARQGAKRIVAHLKLCGVEFEKKQATLIDPAVFHK